MKATHSIEEIIQGNISYCKRFDLNITELDKSLPIMYWLPKMHKTPVGARFIVASYYCSTNPLSDTIPKIFIMVFNTVESFHNKSFFYSGCKKFWVVQNSFPIDTNVNKINVKKKAKSISAFDFSTLYTTILHKLLLKVLSEIINFAFKPKVRKRIGFSKTFMNWIFKGAGRRYFTKQNLVNAISFLINKYFVNLTWFLNKILVYELVLT